MLIFAFKKKKRMTSCLIDLYDKPLPEHFVPFTLIFPLLCIFIHFFFLLFTLPHKTCCKGDLATLSKQHQQQKNTNNTNFFFFLNLLTRYPICSSRQFFFSCFPALFHNRILKSTKSAEVSIATEHFTFESCIWKWFRKINFFFHFPGTPYRRWETPWWVEAWIWELLLQPYLPLSLVLASQSSLYESHQNTQRSIK